MRRRDPVGLMEAVQSGTGVERPFRCHMHDDANASASVNVEKGLWVCYACGAAGRVDRKGATLTSEMKSVLQCMRGEEAPQPKDERWLVWTDGFAPHPYWTARFGEQVAKMHRLGTDPVTGMPCYPFRDDRGRLLGLVVRTGSDGMKYRYPKGVSTARTMYNIAAARSKGIKRSLLVVCEGAADAIAVETATRDRDDVVAVASYGAGLHRPQVDLVNALGPAAVLLGFDNDPAGDRAGGRDYGLDMPTERVRWPEKDPGECTRGQVVAAIEEAASAWTRSGRAGKRRSSTRSAS